MGQEVPVYIQGEVLDIQWWRGMETIRTMNPRVKTPVGGMLYRIGSNVPITWDPPVGGAVDHYVVQLTRDGGVTWEELAGNVQGTRFDWTSTEPETTNARVRVLAVDNQGVMGYDWNDYPFTLAYVYQPRATSPKSPNQVDTGRTGPSTNRQ